MQPIGPDEHICLHLFSRSKPHAYSLFVLLEADPLHIHVNTFLLKSLHEGSMEFGSMHRNRACPKAAHRLQHRYFHEHLPSPGAKPAKEKRSSNGLQHVGEPELVQSLDGISRQNKARSDFAKLLCALKHEGSDALSLQGKSCGKASNASSNNEHRHVRWRKRLGEFHTNPLSSRSLTTMSAFCFTGLLGSFRSDGSIVFPLSAQMERDPMLHWARDIHHVRMPAWLRLSVSHHSMEPSQKRYGNCNE